MAEPFMRRARGRTSAPRFRCGCRRRFCKTRPSWRAQSMTKVLVIDDEAQIRRFLRAGFDLHGFTVLEAENAAAGLKAATFNKPDLIVLDLNLPDLEGSEVLERIRSWSNVPVIILSIHADEQEKVRLRNWGADNFGEKPLGFAEVRARSGGARGRKLPRTKGGPLGGA